MADRRLKDLLRRIARPLRLAAGRFVLLPSHLVANDRDPLFEKIAWFVSTNKLPGDYLEFGVFRGASFVSAYRALQHVFELLCDPQGPLMRLGHVSEGERQELLALWEGMRFFAFDSFEGLPSTKGIDDSPSFFFEGKYAASIATFLEGMQRAGIPAKRVIAVPGWFEESCSTNTARAHAIEKAAVIHIDCDLYESTRTVLDFVKPFLQDGTVLVFDDWFHYRGHPARGEQRAFHEWSRSLPEWTFSEYQKDGAFRCSFLAHRVIEAPRP